MPITFYGTSGADTLGGSSYNTPLTIYGYGGDDTLWGSH